MNTEQRNLLRSLIEPLIKNTNDNLVINATVGCRANNSFRYQGLSVTALCDIYPGNKVWVFRDTKSGAYYGVREEFNPILNERTFTRKSSELPRQNLSSSIYPHMVFTVDRPNEDLNTMFPDILMTQRQYMLLDDWDWFSSYGVFDFPHIKDYYYWNGSTVSYIFSHPLAVKIGSGQGVSVPADDQPFESNGIEIVNVPLTARYYPAEESSLAARGPGAVYYVLITNMPYRIGGFGGNVPLFKSSEDVTFQIYDAGSSRFNNDEELTYTQFTYRENATASVSLYAIARAEAYTFDWELYEVRTYANYFNASEKGVVFAHAVNGKSPSDPLAGIKYFVGNGKKPSSLSLAETYPSWDWRAYIFEKGGGNPYGVTYEHAAFYLEYFGSFGFNTRNKKAILTQWPDDEPDYNNPGRVIQRVFGVNPDNQELGGDPFKINAYSWRVTSYDKEGKLEVTESSPRPKKVQLTIPINTIPDPITGKTEDFTGQIADFCLPPLWTTNRQVYSFWQIPYLCMYEA